MKVQNLILLFCVCAIFFSCTDDTGSVEVSYKKATAIYGDLDDVRRIPVNHTAEDIINPGKVFVGDDFILIGEEEKGIHVIDNSNPNNPVFINFLNIPGNREFFVSGDLLFAESYYDLVKIDIRDIRNAQLVSRAENIFTTPSLNAAGEELLGFSFENVTEKIDINSDLRRELNSTNVAYFDYLNNIIPVSAVPTSFAGNSNATSGTVNRISYHKEHVYIINSNELKVIKDASNGLEKLESTNSVIRGWGLETVFPYEDALFIGSRSAMDILDITNPGQPEFLYNFSHATSCDPVLAKDKVAYITLRTGDFAPCPGNTNSLVVLDINNLSQPTQTEDIVMTSPYGMTLIGDDLYVAEGENGFKIFDAADRAHPVLTDHVMNIEAYDIIEHPSNTNLLLIAGPNGIEQYSGKQDNSLVLESNISF